MIIFISRRDNDLEVQDLINITCYEVLSKLRDVDERQILHTMFIRDIIDAKTFSSLIEFFLRRRIDHLLFHSMKRSYSHSTKTQNKTSYLFSISKKDVSFFFRKKSSFTIDHHIIVDMSQTQQMIDVCKIKINCSHQFSFHIRHYHDQIE